MKLNIISEDFELINALKEISTFAVKSIDEKDLNDVECDILVVSNKNY